MERVLLSRLRLIVEKCYAEVPASSYFYARCHFFDYHFFAASFSTAHDAATPLMLYFIAEPYPAPARRRQMARLCKEGGM